MTKDDSSSATVLAQVKEVLRTGYPQLASALAEVLDAVCGRHIEEVKVQIPAARGLSDTAALDDLSAVLRSIFTAFDEGRLDLIDLVGPAHAAAREAQGFSVSEVLGEYVLLRRNLKHRLVSKLRRPLDAAEEEALQSAIDAATAAMIVSFAAQREARLRLETTALSDFLASLAHDLRNEINSSMLSMTLLEEMGKDLHESSDGGDEAGPLEREDRMRALFREVGSCRAAMESTVASMTRLLEVERVRNQVEAHVRPTALLLLMKGVARSGGRTEQRS